MILTRLFKCLLAIVLIVCLNIFTFVNGLNARLSQPTLFYTAFNTIVISVRPLITESYKLKPNIMIL